MSIEKTTKVNAFARHRECIGACHSGGSCPEMASDPIRASITFFSGMAGLPSAADAASEVVGLGQYLARDFRYWDNQRGPRR